MKIIIINGPNLNLLGARECGLYGNETLKDIEEYIIKKVVLLMLLVNFSKVTTKVS